MSKFADPAPELLALGFGIGTVDALIRGTTAKDTRERFKTQVSIQAFAVRVGAEWFAGFGGEPGAHVTKLRRHLADARLCVSREKAQNYVARLEKRGHPGARIVMVGAQDDI